MSDHVTDRLGGGVGGRAGGHRGPRGAAAAGRWRHHGDRGGRYSWWSRWPVKARGGNPHADVAIGPGAVVGRERIDRAVVGRKGERIDLSEPRVSAICRKQGRPWPVGWRRRRVVRRRCVRMGQVVLLSRWERREDDGERREDHGQWVHGHRSGLMAWRQGVHVFEHGLLTRFGHVSESVR